MIIKRIVRPIKLLLLAMGMAAFMASVLLVAPSTLPVAVAAQAPTATPTPAPTVPPGVVTATINNPLGSNSLGALIIRVIRFLLTMLGALAVLFIIIGGVRMVTSAGNEKAVTAGKQTVTWAVIGLVVALLAFSVIGLVQNILGRTN